MISFQFQIRDPMGLHARVAGKLVNEACAYDCEISLATDNGCADAKRILSLMRLGATQGTILTFTCKGEDEENAAAALQNFLEVCL